jgi:hypothetical protein
MKNSLGQDVPSALLNPSSDARVAADRSHQFVLNAK